jgi:predicted aldo/keto reductase-like oxidoreductase
MEYTRFGNTDLTVSRFGLGCMRFPASKTEAIRMVRHAIDHGVNYLDTAYVYGNSEVITGEALGGGYREKIVLATKSPIWSIHQYEDFETYLDESLRRLGTDCIDVYLLHNMNPENWKKVIRLDGLTFLDKMIQKGKIRYKAFSIHNTTEAFIEIADAFDWDMAQIQLNLTDAHYQCGIAGLRYGAQKGLAMVIMEPLRGGTIVNNTPKEVHALVDNYKEKRSLVDWCFRWLYDMEEVTTILSGTSSLAQLDDNLRIFDQAQTNVLSENDLALIREIQQIYAHQTMVPCTSCAYCMPCPEGLDIPNL